MHLELGYGLMNYGDIGHALFSTTKQIFQTGSSRLLILQKQAMQRAFVELYNYSFMILMYLNLLFRTYILMNIFYAIIMNMEEDEAAISKENIMFQSRGRSMVMTEFQTELAHEENREPNIFDQIQETETES